LMRTSSRDLRALMTPVDGGEILTAGVPWFVAPFGRDSLITCCEMLLLNREPARKTLRFFARHQASGSDDSCDAEPGKILHELRTGELARAGYVPHSPYYGTADATPLFLMLAAAYYRWTADLDLMADHGDQDGDGFVEYQRRSPGGLHNQGWKDSADAVVHADGSLAEGPIALVEVQGYVYLAKLRMAQVYGALGMPDMSAELRKQASKLKEAFNEAFWMPDEGTFALALDGGKRQVRSVTSNPGHCLYCGVVASDKAPKVAERLMASDMFSGWGIRTLSDESPAYNPMSYHNGSVWPHDNAIIAAGLKRYGFIEATERIATALFDAAADSSDARLPELYCGFPRRADVPVVGYPVACRPQAWAAAAPFLLLQAMLGISPDAPNGVVTINRPVLPSWLRRVNLSAVGIGDSQLSLAFTRRTGEPTAFSLLHRDGDVNLTVQQ
jgi:glycogen debranching enzyme